MRRRPMDHRTHLEPKGEGETSMSGKRMSLEAVYRPDPQDPSDMVKAGLPEPQDPHSNVSYLGTTAVHPRRSSDTAKVSQLRPTASRKNWVVVNHQKGLKRAPTSLYHIHHDRNSGLPKGRESYGDGDPIVVGGRESLLHVTGQVRHAGRGKQPRPGRSGSGVRGPQPLRYA
jgi:hypothetical protein